MTLRAKDFLLPLLAAVFVAIPALLFLPVLYYSLTTPFGLVDDFGDWAFIRILDSPGQFFQWFDDEFLNLGANSDRFRPFWEFYDAVSWKTFGATAWLHHLARWIFHFGAVFAFGAAFLCFVRNGQSAQSTASWFVRLLPLAVLAYVWLFFPNQPASRLGAAGSLHGFLSRPVYLDDGAHALAGRPRGEVAVNAPGIRPVLPGLLWPRLVQGSQHRGHALAAGLLLRRASHRGDAAKKAGSWHCTGDEGNKPVESPGRPAVGPDFRARPSSSRMPLKTLAATALCP